MLLIHIVQTVVDDDRPLDVKNVQRLVKIYQREGCRRQFVSNRILVVIIDQACLETALDLSRISAAALLTRNTNNDPAAVGDYPQLQVPVDVRLICLHGRHRIRAARELLSPRDKWWIANLYLADSSSDVQRSLIEEYANETIPPDVRYTARFATTISSATTPSNPDGGLLSGAVEHGT
ncbi:hypothetical protein LTR93_011123 [Exophiala xenobiotica]|nr:hypothetical protein LTR93_011123 [Exophiala xenobiotica]